MREAQARVSARPAAVDAADLSADVRHYLGQRPRQLPSRYLYDPLGSALFEAICLLPWYRITRAETQLLVRHAADILARLEPLARLVELGSGTGGKLKLLLDGVPRLRPLEVHLIDVSAAALGTAAHVLTALDRVTVVGHQAPYEVGLDELRRAGTVAGRTAVAFLGSNIGNFDPAGADAVLRHVRSTLRAGDALLLGADLIKSERDLLLAYDDPLGVTAAFNRNLLVRINRELGADFDLSSFRHRAVWNPDASRVEMHLVSTRPQRVRVPGAGLAVTLADGESIWTESSYKYRPDDIARLLVRTGFGATGQWIDRDAGFALTLAAAR